MSGIKNMAKNDVLLIHPPTSFNTVIAGGYDNVPPLGILYLAAVLERERIRVEILDDLDASLSLKEILKVIKKEEPKIIGISSTTCQIKSAVEIARAVRERFGKDIRIGIGGCHISADPGLIERYPVFDFGVIGEGEKIFPVIVKKILQGQKVKGLFIGEPVKNLDTIPFPAYHLVDMEKYKKRGMTGFPILGTRGCPYRCIFCSRPGMGGFGRLVRSRSGKNIVDEMETILDKYGGPFDFWDDSFTINRGAVIDLCQEVLRRRLKVRWSAGGVRADQIDEQLLELMVKAGCTGFCFGIESGSERVRNSIVHKGIKDSQIYQALNLCNRYPFLNIQLAFIIGFPTETKKEKEKTVMFGRKLIDTGIRCLEYIAIMLPVPLPGAELFTRAVKEKKIPEDIIDQYITGKLGDSFRDHWPVYISDGTTREEMDKMRRGGYKAFYFTPYYIKRRIKKDITSWAKLKRDVAEVLSIITSARSRASFS